MSTLHTDSDLMNLLDRIAAQDDTALKSLYESTSSRLLAWRCAWCATAMRPRMCCRSPS